MATKASKTLEEYLELNYPFRVDADPDGGYVISFPDLPGCMTQVEDASEIGQAADEARRLWIMTEFEDGTEIPLPTYPEEYSGKFNLRLPRSLHRRLAELAERDGVSLNQLTLSLLAGGEAVSRVNVEAPQTSPAAFAEPSQRGRTDQMLSFRLRRGIANAKVDLDATALRHVRDALAHAADTPSGRSWLLGSGEAGLKATFEALTYLEGLHHQRIEDRGGRPVLGRSRPPSVTSGARPS